MEREKPRSIEAEKAVLGSVFIDEENVMKKVVDKLSYNDFYRPQHQVIYQTMVELYHEGTTIDYTTLSNRLSAKNLLIEVGGVKYLVDLFNFVPSTANIDSYIMIVSDKALIRNMMDAAQLILEDGYKTVDAIEFVDEAEKKVFNILKGRRSSKFIPIGPIVKDVIETAESIKDNEGNITGLDTGFTGLNQFTLGLQPSELIIVAARPSIGKSAFALNIATNVAKGMNNPSVAFFSLEMGVEQLVARILSREAHVAGQNLKSGNLNAGEWAQLNVANDSLSKLNMYFDDSGTVKVTEVRSKCRKLKQEGNLDLVLIDYLQLLSGTENTKSNRVQEVSEISRMLKEMARELKIPVIALSQLSRGVESRQDKRPVMSDLRESGSIEQDADIVLFLYRDDYYDKDTTKEGILEINVAKNRSGATGSFELLFHKSTSSFYDKASENGDLDLAESIANESSSRSNLDGMENL